MSIRVFVEGGGSYQRFGAVEACEEEYERFRGCLMQLLDDETLVGDAEGRWVIFQNGWVYGMATYASESDANAFARQMFRGETDANYIIAQVDPEKHALSAMHLLASVMGDADEFDITTAPDEVNRDQNDE